MLNYKIGFQCFGSDGDIQPHVDLAIGLAERGHHVEMFIISLLNTNYSYLNDINGIHIEQELFPADFFEKNDCRGFWDFNRRKYKYYFERQYSEVRDKYLASAYQLVEDCDLVIGPRQIFELQYCAELKNIPYISLASEHLFIPSTLYAAPEAKTGTASENIESWNNCKAQANRTYLKQLNELRKNEFGFAPLDDYFSNLYSRRLNIVRYSRNIFSGDPNWEKNHKLCGYFKPTLKSTRWTLPEDLKEFINKASTPILITMGSMIKYEPDLKAFNQLLIKAVQLTGERAIIKTNCSDGFEEFDNIYFLNGFVNYQDLMPMCKMVVHHGGAGTSHDTLANGVSSLVVAYGFDQKENADLLIRAGVSNSYVNRKGLTAEKLANSICLTSRDQNLGLNAQKIAKKMESEDGLVVALNAIEEELQSKTIEI